MNNPAALLTALENAPQIIVPLVREAGAEILKRRPQPQKWSIHEHACHLADVHPLFFARLDQMLSQEHPRIVPYHPPQAAQEGALLDVDLDEALERFTTDRRRLIERLGALRAEDWERTAEHEEYARYSIFIMFRHLALHDLSHAYRIEELLFKRDWD